MPASRGLDRDHARALEPFPTSDLTAYDPSFLSGFLAEEYALDAVARGALVVETSSHYRLSPSVPLVVPEVNGDTLADFGTSGLVACPSAATTGCV